MSSNRAQATSGRKARVQDPGNSLIGSLYSAAKVRDDADLASCILSLGNPTSSSHTNCAAYLPHAMWSDTCEKGVWSDRNVCWMRASVEEASRAVTADLRQIWWGRDSAGECSRCRFGSRQRLRVRLESGSLAVGQFC